MRTELEYLSQNLYCLRTYLLEPVIAMQGACKLLHGKLPEPINDTVNRISIASEKLLSELHRFPENAIDLQSPKDAARQLHSLAAKWEKDTRDLSLLVNEIKTTDVYLEDAGLERILKEVISNGFHGFQSFIPYIKMAKAEYLIQDDGYAKVLNIDISK